MDDRLRSFFGILGALSAEATRHEHGVEPAPVTAAVSDITAPGRDNSFRSSDTA